MKKKLFYGFSIQCPWPKFSFKGKILDEENRHVTVAFLGNQDLDAALSNVQDIKFPFKFAPTGIMKDHKLLPENTYNVLAYEFFLVSQKDDFQSFVHYISDESFLPHVSIVRNPDSKEMDGVELTPLPFYMDGFHLYESLGNSQYKSRYSISFAPPFKEYEHTADMAYEIIGETYLDLYHHAQVALAFYYPPFIECFAFDGHIQNENELVKELNRLLGKVDAKFGCPYKAVSFHGNIKKGDLLKWEMVVDV